MAISTSIATALQPSDARSQQVYSLVVVHRQRFHTVRSRQENGMKSTVLHWLHWFGEAMVHTLGLEQDRHLQPPPIGPQPYRDVPTKPIKDW